MRHTVMALFPAFAEEETKRAESSSKGGEYILYILIYMLEFLCGIYTSKISNELLQVLAIPMVKSNGLFSSFS